MCTRFSYHSAKTTRLDFTLSCRCCDLLLVNFVMQFGQQTENKLAEHVPHICILKVEKITKMCHQLQAVQLAAVGVIIFRLDSVFFSENAFLISIHMVTFFLEH